ncbi:hypothetical protein SNOG_00723 [Parastagonospora nodorum SN15]|uniref:Uncharacterized protein n=1 Tax=Phaeosphaeria nodorum (strain SN15 / ATCC MYA-4574 / FGSC 10173) TaxID=321614 RepID=Q0V5J1_PHANO|nr:hypothetical protein SNOG_00723 [Parastagonospora nodorum SN15]EAT92218.1 hypothetical protein SNOG_00723 [Parastagonospora nodorum SN15]
MDQDVGTDTLVPAMDGTNTESGMMQVPLSKCQLIAASMADVLAAKNLFGVHP